MFTMNMIERDITHHTPLNNDRMCGVDSIYVSISQWKRDVKQLNKRMNLLYVHHPLYRRIIIINKELRHIKRLWQLTP